MQKAGGIIALIAGIFGFIAAIITLLAGGLVAGIESISDSSNSASTEIGTFGMLGIVFSFLTIVFGAIAIGAKSKISGICFDCMFCSGGNCWRYFSSNLHGTGISGRNSCYHRYRW